MGGRGSCRSYLHEITIAAERGRDLPLLQPTTIFGTN